MALEQIKFNIASFNDADAGGNNYYSGAVYEVYNIDDTLADIFSDAAGANPITQNGIQNVSNNEGRCVFYIEGGDYYIKVGSEIDSLVVGVDVQLINILSQAYEFATAAEYQAFTTTFPDGKIINLLDRNASFKKVNGAVTADGYGSIGGIGAFQTIEIIDNGTIYLSQYGVKENDASETAFINSLLFDLASTGKKFVSDIELTINASLLVRGFRVDVEFLENITATTEDPILEIKCNYSRVQGRAVGLTELVMPGNSPNGIVWIDEEGISNISYNNIGNFQLIGNLQPSGGGSKGLVMRSLDGYLHFTYYNTLHDFKIRNVDTGIFMAGNINANIFDKIILENCGNFQLYTDSAGWYFTEAPTVNKLGEVINEGPLENMVSNVFHTASNSAVSLYFVGKVYNNFIDSYGAETGGAGAISFKTVASTFAYGNTVNMSAIAFGGYQVDPVYYEENSFNDSGDAHFRSLSTNAFKASTSILVGSSTDVVNEGVYFPLSPSAAHISKEGTTTLRLNQINSSYGDNYIQFLSNGGLAGSIGVNALGDTSSIIFAGATTSLQFESTTIAPTNPNGDARDNVVQLGKASSRFTEVFAVNGAINTSDERYKEFFDIDQVEKDVALIIKANIKKFKWNDAKERELGGGKKARLHFGVGAQFVRDTFIAASLNPDDYAFFCFDEWEEEVATIATTYKDDATVKTPQRTITYPAIHADDGSLVESERVEIVPAVYNDDATLLTEEHEVVTQEAGNRYGIRYSELAMFILSAM